VGSVCESLKRGFVDSDTVERAKSFARWCERVYKTEHTITRMRAMSKELGDKWSSTQVVYHKKRLKRMLANPPPRP
jgi:hypothetical protein